MIALTIKDQQIEILRSKSLSIEYRSPIWMGDDVDVVPGDVVIPFDVQLTRHNNNLLGFIDSFGNRKTIKQFKDATLWVDGNEHLQGTLEVQKINGAAASAKISSGVGALQGFKEKYINDPTVYLTNETYNHSVANMNLSISTSATIANNDYLFVPLFDRADGNLYNRYRNNPDSFDSSIQAVPFYNACRLLKQLMEGQGWTLHWKEYAIYEKYLQVVCNQSVSGDFKRTDILPPILISEYIKWVCAATGSLVLVNTETKTLTLKKYDELGKGSVLDWTDKVLRTTGQEFVNETFDKSFDGFLYEQKNYVNVSRNSQSQVIYSQQSYPVIDEYITGTVITTVIDSSSGTPITTDTETITTRVYKKENGKPVATITITVTETIDGVVQTPSVTTIKEDDFKLKLIYYRGQVETDGGAFGYYYPLASTNPAEVLSTNEIDFSLEWDNGSIGINQKYLKWSKIISNTRLITFEMNLTASDIRGFHFSQVIRILNQNDSHYYNFLVKSIKQTVNTRQRETATVEMLLLD